jgi:hypothetical protein
MVKLQFLLTSAAMLMMSSGSSMADQPVTVSQIEVADASCPSEWSDLTQLKPNAWVELSAFEVDPEIAPATTDAFNKSATAVIAMADYMGSFVGLTDPENQNPTFLALAHAKYELVMCLIPTEAERNLIIELAILNGIASDEEIRGTFFKGFDQFHCMRVADASEQIFDLDTLNRNFSSDFEAITTSTMKVCN